MEGWNDPPELFDRISSTGKINLNKRIAFPLNPQQGQQVSSTSPVVGQMPPKPPSISDLSKAPPSTSNEDSKNEAEIIDVNAQKTKTIELFSKLVTEEISSSAQPSIQTKIKALEDDWNNCNVDVEILKLVVELSEHLEKKDSKKAASIHRKIIMKGCNKQWMLALRQIIINMETKSIELTTST